MNISSGYIQQEVLNAEFAAFESTALQIFRFQYQENPVYRSFCDALHRPASTVTTLSSIPFLPIQFFKSKTIHSTVFSPELIFESSGTTGSINSRHEVKEGAVYEQSFLEGFKLFYGDPSRYCIIGLLPSYLERQHSSLVYMVNDLVKRSGHANSGFYLYDHAALHDLLVQNEAQGQPTLLVGVTYALLDFAEQFPMQLKHTSVMETGGMKGRREELTRGEVHERLKQQLGLSEIHSEYGMTELLSQAYSYGNGIFQCPPWMQVMLRQEDDPFELSSFSDVDQGYRSGAVNIIDLANVYSCSFIATDDIGRIWPGNKFEIIGRIDHSDTRGCGLMIL